MGLLERIISLASKLPVLGPIIDRAGIDTLARATTPRPRRFSLWDATAKPADSDQQGPVSDYTSWPSLTDRSFSGRHLPPADQASVDALPPDTAWSETNIGDITALFRRGEQMVPGRSSALFMFFAQWFTDSFMRTDPGDRRRNSSNHDIDLCQIYGLSNETTQLLRSQVGGQLNSQRIDGEEFPDYLYQRAADGSWIVKDRYQTLPYLRSLDDLLKKFPEARKEKIYATGLERGNSTLGYVALSTLFLREHNRVCDVITKDHPEWDDERLFQTARMINTALLLKIVIEDYINHLAGHRLYRLDTGFAERQRWYRPNWIAVEFNLLYRWHSLVPDRFTLNGTPHPPSAFRTNNALLEQAGLVALFEAASSQPAGKIGLLNTPAFLLPAEYQSIKMARDFRLQSYNDYRVHFGLLRLTDFSELTEDKAVQQRLESLYESIDSVEFLIGLYAEDAWKDSPFGQLMTIMVGCDAFTQVLTNPLLSTNIFTAETFTRYGLDLIGKTSSLQDIVARNSDGGRASFDFRQSPS